MRHIYKCANCSKYTMKEACDCGNKALPAKPVKYSVEDRLAAYRRKAKMDHYKKSDLL